MSYFHLLLALREISLILFHVINPKILLQLSFYDLQQMLLTLKAYLSFSLVPECNKIHSIRSSHSIPRQLHKGIISQGPNTVTFVSQNQILNHCIKPEIIYILITEWQNHRIIFGGRDL